MSKFWNVEADDQWTLFCAKSSPMPVPKDELFRCSSTGAQIAPAEQSSRVACWVCDQLPLL